MILLCFRAQRIMFKYKYFSIVQSRVITAMLFLLFMRLVARNFAEIRSRDVSYNAKCGVYLPTCHISGTGVTCTFLNMHAFPRTRALLCTVRLMNIKDCNIESCVCISSCEPCHNIVYALGNIDICRHVVEDIAII